MNRAVMVLLVVASLACADDARVRELIRDLGDDDVSRREQATEELEKLGDADDSGSVERLLDEASHDADPERAHRSEDLLKEIRWWDRIEVLHTGVVDLRSGEFLWQSPRSFCLSVRRNAQDSLAWFRGRHDEILCVDLRTGKPKWSLPVQDCPTMVGDEYLLVYDNNSLSRVSLDKGECVWKTDISPLYGSLPHKENDHIDVTANHDIVFIDFPWTVAFEAGTGRQLWKRPDLRTDPSLLEGDRVYGWGMEERKRAFLHRLDGASGEDLWKENLPGWLNEEEVFGTGSACGLILASGSMRDVDPWTVAIDVETGKTRWTLPGETLACWFEPDGAHAWRASVDRLAVVDLARGSSGACFPFERGRPNSNRVVKFLVDGPHLYVLECGTQDAQVSLSCFDVAGRTRTWSADTSGLGELPDSTPAFFMAFIEKVGHALVVHNNNYPKPLLFVIDPASGAVVSRFRPKPDDRLRRK